LVSMTAIAEEREGALGNENRKPTRLRAALREKEKKKGGKGKRPLYAQYLEPRRQKAESGGHPTVFNEKDAREEGKISSKTG